jgi:hypothetical protein
MKNIIEKAGRKLQHFHDDEYSDESIEILPMPYDTIFGDYRLFNGLPLPVMDEFLTRFRILLTDLMQAHETHKDYWRTHPNVDE